MKYLFEWTPKISVNDTTIDEQHQRLLGQVNTLLSYIVAEKNDAMVIDAVTFLDKYINDHLAYEEKYMLEHKYPDFEKHIKYHQDFIEHYKIFKEKLLAGVPRKDLAFEIEQYIGNWWLAHIGIEDHKYAEYIKQQEL